MPPEEQNKKHLFCGKALAFWLYPGTAQIAKAFFFFFPAVCFLSGTGGRRARGAGSFRRFLWAFAGFRMVCIQVSGFRWVGKRCSGAVLWVFG